MASSNMVSPLTASTALPSMGGRLTVSLISTSLNKTDRKSTRLNSSHRDLHSFPTRRSSDLHGKLQYGLPLDGLNRPPIDGRAVDGIAHLNLPQQDRSEEHTSELQSPRPPLFPYTTLFRSSWQAPIWSPP